MKEFYTTGDVARICGISPRTVVNYCEQGKIGNVKSPVTHYRRIPHVSLCRFMEEHGIPVTSLESLTSKTVIIADDDAVDAAVIRRMLEDVLEDVTIVTVDNGYDALIETGALKPDCLILDIAMPRIDGIEVLHRLKHSESTRHITILVYTGNDDPDFEKTLLDSGAAGLLNKNLPAEEFKKALEAEIAKFSGKPANSHS